MLSNRDKVNKVGEKYIMRSSIIYSHHLARWKQMGDTEGHYGSRHRSVITVNSLWAGGPDFRSRQGQEFLFATNYRQTLGSTQLSVNVTGTFSSRYRG
jgi:hypothetical protein